MQCPIDGTPLVITDRSGVEIDYCPQCRGVWLDRGELDKIIDRAAPQAAPPRPAPGGYQGGHSGYQKKKKRGGFLDELFDF
jgi:Zn-finger nucleic acid-binding protein